MVLIKLTIADVLRCPTAAAAGSAVAASFGSAVCYSLVGTVGAVGSTNGGENSFLLDDKTGQLCVQLPRSVPQQPCTGDCVRCLGTLADWPGGRRLHATAVAVVDGGWELVHAMEVQNLRAAGFYCRLGSQQDVSRVGGGFEEQKSESWTAMTANPDPPCKAAQQDGAPCWLPSQLSPPALLESTPATVEAMLLLLIRSRPGGCSVVDLEQSSEFANFVSSRGDFALRDALERLQQDGDIYYVGDLFYCL